MQRVIASIVAAAALAGGSLRAQNIDGVWQGSVAIGGSQYRQVLRLSRGDNGWRAVYFSLDQASDQVPVHEVRLKGRDLVIAFADDPQDLANAQTTYQGTLSADGRTIAGTWIEPGARYPIVFKRVSGKDVWALPPSHTSRFVAVEPNVKLEVLDWGGSGPPLVFLAGFGNTAHVFDEFAPKFIKDHHVYGITRRGFGVSSSPALTPANYAANRLGDDVLAVIDSLGLTRPVLVGHSIAGQELSSIGSRYPAKVAGLVYLDAGYGYAFYNPAMGDLNLDRKDLAAALTRLEPGRVSGEEFRAVVRALRDSLLPRFENDLQDYAKRTEGRPPIPEPPPDTAPSLIRAFMLGGAKYVSIPVPILAFYASSHRRDPPPPGFDSAAVVKWRAEMESMVASYADGFERGVPTARVVRLSNATHYVFQSNEADVLREMNAFLATVSR